jgi:hypothetical protein
MDDEPAYHVDHEDDTWGVYDAQGQRVCACGSELNAQHYAEMLNRAYKRGYKAGYRAAKRAIRE